MYVVVCSNSQLSHVILIFYFLVVVVVIIIIRSYLSTIPYSILSFIDA